MNLCRLNACGCSLNRNVMSEKDPDLSAVLSFSVNGLIVAFAVNTVSSAAKFNWKLNKKSRGERGREGKEGEQGKDSHFGMV